MMQEVKEMMQEAAFPLKGPFSLPVQVGLELPCQKTDGYA